MVLKLQNPMFLGQLIVVELLFSTNVEWENKVTTIQIGYGQNIQHGQNVSCSISVRKVRICPLRARICLNKHIFHTLADCVVCWVQKSHILEFWNLFHPENSQNTHFRKKSVKCYKWILPFRHIRLMCVFNELWRVRGPFWKVKTET